METCYQSQVNVVSTSCIRKAKKIEIVNLVRRKRGKKECIRIHIEREDNLKNCILIYVWPQDFNKDAGASNSTGMYVDYSKTATFLLLLRL